MRSKIDMEEVRNRYSALSMDYTKPSTNNVEFLYESILEKYSFNNVKLLLKDWKWLNVNTNMAFAKVMDIYDEVCKYGTETEIRYVTSAITEGILHKVRNGKQAEECVHRKIGWNKRKLHEKIDDRMDELKGAVHNAGQNFKNGVEDIKNKNKAQFDKLTGKDKKKEQAANEGYQAILDKCIIIEQCDRVLRNHNKLSKRFNIDKIVRESVYSEDDMINTILEFCKYIDTYDMPIGVRYNVALENILYCFDKNNLNYNPSTIASTITDYFLMSNTLTESVVHDIRYILSKNRFYTDDELSSVNYVFQDTFNESNINYEDDDIAILEDAKKKEDPKKAINQFKMLPQKTIGGMKGLISKMYVKCNDSIIYETVNIFAIIRVFFVLGATVLHPALGLVTFLTDQFIKLDMNRKSADKVIIQYEKEIDRVERQIEKAKNENNKKKLIAYRDKLKEELRKIESHFESYFSDAENEKRSDAKYDREAKRDAKRHPEEKDDFDYSFDNIKFEQDTLKAAGEILLIEQLIDKIKDWDPSMVTTHICESIDNISLDDLDSIIEIAQSNPEMFDILKLRNTMEVSNSLLAKQSGIDKFIRMDCYSDNIRKLDNVSYVDEVTTDINKLYNIYTNLDLAYEGIKETLHEANEDKEKENEQKEKIKIKDKQQIPEKKNKDIITNKPKKPDDEDDHKPQKTGVSAATKVKIASMSLKKGIQTGADTEKNLSRKVDMSMDAITKNIDRALSAQNREAVIKGTILPSASKVIKTAIISGAAFLVNPAVAVIGLLGYIGISAKHRQKERQLIMDEIDVELNMCERYIKLAEEKNDMKAIKNLLQTKRALEKQRANLKYNMKYQFREPTNYGANNNPSNED